MYDERVLLSFNLQFFAEGDAGDKTEPATAKKLNDARKEGQVAKSTEIVHSVMLISFFVVLRITVGFMAEKMMEGFPNFYNRISTLAVSKQVDTSLGAVNSLFQEGIIELIVTLIPIFAVGFLIAFVGNVVQVKFVVSAKPLMPKFSKLNPVNGFKRMFSLQSLINLMKSVLLVAIIGFVSISTIRDNYGLLMNILDYSLPDAVIQIGTMVLDLAIKISAIYLAVGFVDLIYQKRKFAKDMRMSKQEVKEEYKQTEGDPQIKGQIRRRMREASQRRMMQQLPEADVVITNPTHLAVAIKYDANEQFSAPVVIAKGEDYLAQKIKEAAKEHGIEIVENKPLARALYYNVDIGSEIPQELYEAVAEVLVFVYKLKGKTKSSDLSN